MSQNRYYRGFEGVSLQHEIGGLMFSINLSKLNINEAELKAYIYQQLNDIQPYIDDEEPIAIKMAYSEDDGFIVKMQYHFDGSNIEAESTGGDIYSAISGAKEAFIKTLHSLDQTLAMEEAENTMPAVTSHIEKKTVH